MTVEHTVSTPKTARVRVTYGSQAPKTPTTPLRFIKSPVHTVGKGSLTAPKRAITHHEEAASSDDEDEDLPQPKKRLVQTSLQLSTCRLTATKAKHHVAMDKMFPEILGTCDTSDRLFGTKSTTVSRNQQAVVEGPRKEQTFLDFGQKPLATEPCAECGMAYQRGREEDEALHTRFHRNWLRQQTRLLSWTKVASSKDEDPAESVALPSQLIEKHGDHQAMATIHIVDVRGATKRELQRALEILNIANDHLGAVHVGVADMALRQRKIFLYVSPRSQVLGCILAEMISSARRVVSSGDSSMPSTAAIECAGDPCQAVCGISRVWVAPSARRCGVATQMIAAVCKRFVYGCAIDPALVAFTQPTLDGRALAEHVFGRKDFLAYVED
ncbi:hypothetical protein IW146_005107 [Coemansia sp. RSA 922]|nr:hypothetical protein H4S03_003744 [Coemansia sp. S3946]KAJ2050021.1 hypothetical protein H4S04_002865 [Coemansia sp. S16]KAJ2054539.1 hypothetical protein GGH13_008178 [Coemansia sp. S155-1]KAJ2111787.1 hypothetical protein IW146_005107 [Coemansia sp. RSA 922]KAJ2344923.1 hypothetical protein GGH92_004276 [Coemansia sp. RSA 2673]KAJ2427786.1 hypothetical protein GGF41_001572 [Coemansia sp. RSA 2531]